MRCKYNASINPPRNEIKLLMIKEISEPTPRLIDEIYLSVQTKILSRKDQYEIIVKQFVKKIMLGPKLQKIRLFEVQNVILSHKSQKLNRMVT